MKHGCTRRFGLRWFLQCLIGLIAPGMLHASPVCVQNVCDLGVLGGTTGSNAMFINAAGDVVGSSYTANYNTSYTFLYISGANSLIEVDAGAGNVSPEGLNSSGQVSATVGDVAILYQNPTFTTYPVSGPSYAGAVNDSGTVIGTSPSSQQAFIWNGSTTSNLGTLGVGGSSTGKFINNAGDMAGYSTNGTGQSYAFYLQNGATLNNGGCLSGPTPTCGEITIGGNSTPQAMNSSGQVVGLGYTGTGTNGNEHAFVYTPSVSGGSTQDLGTLELNNNGNSDALAINNNGEVVGYSDLTSSSGDAFSAVYNSGSGLYVMTDLGSLPSMAYSEAEAVNDNGVIVGTSFTSPIPTTAELGEQAFIDVGGVMTNLNTLLPAGTDLTTLLTATGINDEGEIIGQAETNTGAIDAYVLSYTGNIVVSQTPEPSTVILSGLGVMLLCCIAWRKRYQ